jgi:predicted cobalt transporter CbtA
MARILIVFTAGLIAGLVLTIMAIIFVIPGKLFVEQESPLGFNETVHA